MEKHLLGKKSTYLVLIGVSVGILLLELLVITILDKMNMGEYVNDTIAEGVAFLICFPGIIVGIIGTIICSFRK